MEGYKFENTNEHSLENSELNEVKESFSDLSTEIDSVGGIEGIEMVVSDPEKADKLNQRLAVIDSQIDEQKFRLKSDVEGLKGQLNPFKSLYYIWNPDIMLDTTGDKIGSTVAYLTGAKSLIAVLGAIESKLKIQLFKLDKVFAKM
jgi:hypothetical protein